MCISALVRLSAVWRAVSVGMEYLLLNALTFAPVSTAWNRSISSCRVREGCVSAVDMHAEHCTTVPFTQKCFQATVLVHRYTYTSEDVARMIEERRAKGAKGFNVAAERMRLSNLREYEAGRGNTEAVAR